MARLRRAKFIREEKKLYNIENNIKTEKSPGAESEAVPRDKSGKFKKKGKKDE